MEFSSVNNNADILQVLANRLQYKCKIKTSPELLLVQASKDSQASKRAKQDMQLKWLARFYH